MVAACAARCRYLFVIATVFTNDEDYVRNVGKHPNIHLRDACFVNYRTCMLLLPAQDAEPKTKQNHMCTGTFEFDCAFGSAQLYHAPVLRRFHHRRNWQSARDSHAHKITSSPRLLPPPPFPSATQTKTRDTTRESPVAFHLYCIVSCYIGGCEQIGRTA